MKPAGPQVVPELERQRVNLTGEGTKKDFYFKYCDVRLTNLYNTSITSKN